MILNDIFITTAVAEIDKPFFFKLADNVNNALLSGMDVPDLDRTDDVDFFLHHLDATPGHITEELLLLLFVGAFQRCRKGPSIHALQNLTNGSVVEGSDLFEYEHQFANRICYVRLGAIDFFENGPAFAAVYAVEKLGNGSNTSKRLVMGVCTHGLKFLFEHGRNPPNHIGRDCLQTGHTHGHVRLNFSGHGIEQFRVAYGGEMRENQRNRLGMFVLD